MYRIRPSQATLMQTGIMQLKHEFMVLTFFLLQKRNYLTYKEKEKPIVMKYISIKILSRKTQLNHTKNGELEITTKALHEAVVTDLFPYNDRLASCI